jgi:predicted Zn-dependent protease
MNCFSNRFFVLIISMLFMLVSCKKTTDSKNEITPEDDQIIGETLNSAIIRHINDHSNMLCLERADHSGAYAYLDKIQNLIDGSSNFVGLASLPNASISSTTIHLISEANNTGAFIVPGGHIYLYTEFLKKIKTEAQFVGVLSHLLACSKGRHPTHKMEDRFSTSFMIDLALGSGFNSTGNVNIATILSELEDVSYDSLLVKDFDIEAEHTICELRYDIQSYSDLFGGLNCQNLKWYLQFPRLSNSDYTSHLFNTVKNTTACSLGEEVAQPAYAAFKCLLP